MMEWRFKQLTKNDTLQNAAHLEFFHNEALNSSVDALVREDIQNRLDARHRNAGCVEVRYKLCGPAGPNTRAAWFHGLAHHLSADAVAEELGYKPTMAPPLTWLVIEDFNTTGLEGDPLVFQDPEHRTGTPRNDFFWFVRNVGRSGKKGGDRGRWGLGKIVYPASSRIRSFFAYTVRHSDSRRLLIGRSVLAVHHSECSQHDSEGYFGNYNDTQHAYFATPETGDVLLDQFKSDFRLTRTGGESGLSLVIPWPDEDITYRSLVSSVIDHWFWVILDGRLRVQISQDGGSAITISAENIEAVIRSHQDETTLQAQQLLRRIKFARTAQQFDLRGPDFFHLQNCRAGSAPKWDNPEDRFPDGALAQARQAFRDGRALGFDLPVRVKRMGATISEDASFEVYLKKTDAGHPPVEVFLREGLCISGQKFLREHGIIAVVKVENDALGTMLGDAENPAHTRWERNGKHFKNRYEYGPSYLSYVQRAAQNLCWVLSKHGEGLDRDLLKNLFYLPEDGNLPIPAPRRPGAGEPPPIPPIIPREAFIQCTQLSNGFRIRPNPRATRFPAQIQIRAAYEVIGGSPFKFHHPADFDFSNPAHINMNLRGAEIVSTEPCKLTVAVNSPDFEISVTGFDPHRDLLVDAKPLHDNEPATVCSPDEVEVGI